ncbi:RluA family pseudouridine synthase [Planctomycetota bacterium]|nr:RluA family pseudouridine synthase [Planctomycetota bacterium]
MVLPPGRDLSRPPESAIFRVRQDLRTRLDRWLQERLGWKSRTKIQKLIQMERVKVNGEKVKASTKVSTGDEVEVFLDVVDTEESGTLSLPILYQDPWLVALDKPAGILVHPVGRTHSGTVVDGLHLSWQALNDSARRQATHRLCHRLDRETSGLLLLAKSVQARRHLQDSFEGDRVRKSYIAIVEGVPDAENFEINAAVSAHLDPGKQDGHRLAKADEERGKASKTLFRTLGSQNGISVILCRPITGRQNQIRIHLQVAGHPILGDVGYGQTPESLQRRSGKLPEGIPHPERALLHSFQLTFPHPVWQTASHVRCRPSGEMARLIHALKTDSDPLIRSFPLLEDPKPLAK